MQSGLLTDTFSREHVARFADDDWRRRSPDFNEPTLSHNLALRDALRPIAQRHRATVSAVAVAWVLAWPGVTGAIVGGRSPQQVDGWIGAASLELTTADLQEISDAIVRTGAGEGPTIPQFDPIYRQPKIIVKPAGIVFLNDKDAFAATSPLLRVFS